MEEDGQARRGFLKQSVLGAVGAMAAAVPVVGAQAASPASAAASQPTPASSPSLAPSGYVFFRPAEAAFVEALVDHMAPADQYTPKGTDLGLATYFDRALASAWGKGDRLYLQGPYLKGTANQGYQLPMTPAELFRSGTEAANDYCLATYRKTFDALPAVTKEELLKGLQSGAIALVNGLPARAYFAQLYQLFVESMFADPIYGGNRNKAGWRMIGFTGVIQTNRRNVVQFKNKPFNPEILGIADLS